MIIIGAFENYCSLNFFKGGMIDDRYNLLIKPGENTQLTRQMHFTNVDEIAEKEKIIGEYILRAIEVEEKGEEPKFQIELKIPVELQKEFKTNSKLEKSFFSLTPGRQRAYLIYFSSAKQSKTLKTRIKKLIPKILLGKGLND